MEKSQVEKELDQISQEPIEKYTAPTVKNKRNLRVNVRLDEKTYNKLCEMKKITGKSFATLLRETFIKKPLSQPVFNIKQAQVLIAEACRISGNVNQIAKRMNSGCFYGWYEDFQIVNKDIANLFCVVANYGRGKKS